LAENLYITGVEAESGKSIVALAMMEMLSGRVHRIGFFRPLIHTDTQSDPLIHLMCTRYRLETARDLMYGCTTETARRLVSADRYGDLLKLILERFHALREQCDQVLCAGTNFTGVAASVEYDFNIDVANNLGCLTLPVVRGLGRSTQEILDTTLTLHKSFLEHHSEILATVVNRVASDRIDEVRDRLARRPAGSTPVYVLPDVASLAKPAIGDIARALAAEVIYGDTDSLNREVCHYKVAAMELPDFLDHIEEGSLIITPGDRSDIIIGSLLTHPSSAYPQISGLLLSGNQPPAVQVRRLIEGLGKPPVAVLGVATDTFTTALNVNAVPAVLAPENERRIATALGTVETSIDLQGLEQRLAVMHPAGITPLMFEHDLITRARAVRRHIVLPEGNDERILRAAEILTLRGVVDITLLGNRQEVQGMIVLLGLQIPDAAIVDPLDSEWRARYAETYYALRRHKGISRAMAFDAMADVSYFGTMMVHHGQADGMVSGAAHTTQHTIRPAFEIIRARPGSSLVSSVFLMCLDDRVLVYGDCAVNPNPNAAQLADIAVDAAATARMFGIEPRIAMLSYSTGDSGKGEAVDTVREATRIARQRLPELRIEGPIQYDAAVDASVARTKLPESAVAGNASVFIFPDLNTGNNTYKAVQRSANAVAIGPILQGLNKPVNDLSRGCTVTDIVNTVAITAIQGQSYGQRT
jgi:phosphate acetyltransferase